VILKRSLYRLIRLITSEQIRAARALLRISVIQLAKLSEVGEATIKRIEAGRGLPSANIKTLDSITKAFEKSGIEFIGTPDDRPGVRLK
jgi:transcriptional regulator with XRE-family HTH domain